MRNPYLYYKIPQALRDFLNSLIPGLIPEPALVRVRSEAGARRGEHVR